MLLFAALAVPRSLALAADNYGNATTTLIGDWTNYGTVTTTGDNEPAMSSSAGQASTNAASGTLTTSGASAYGLYATDHSTATNSGSIHTSSDHAYGIYAYDHSMATNSGDITTSGVSAYGMYVDDHSTAANSGSIHTLADNTCGIFADDHSTVTNSGDITASDANSYGIYATDHSTVYNSGSITATATGTSGIRALNSTVYNSGSISGEHAIFSSDSDIHLQTGTRILAGQVVGYLGTTNHLFLDGSGTVDFDIADDWASLTKTGSGAWTLARNITGNVQGLDLQGGTLAVAGGVSLNINGNYVQAAGTTLTLPAGGASTPLTTTGTATLNGTLAVDVAGGSASSTLLDAAGGLGGTTFSQVVSSNPNFSVGSVTYGANTVSVAGSSFAPQSDGPSLSSLSTLGSAQAFANVAQARSLTLLTDKGNLGPDREFMVASAGSLSGLLNPRQERSWSMFLQPVYSTTSRSSHGSGEGYDADFAGLEAGIDRRIDNHWVVGAMAGIGRADIEFSGSSFVSGDTEDQTLTTLGAYAGYSWGDWLFTDTLSLTYADQDSQRNAGLGQTARADYDSWLTRNQFLAVYRWRPAVEWEVAPRAGLDVTYLHRGGFSETGAVNAVSYDDLDKVFADASLGLRATRTWALDNGVEVGPYLGGGAVHALGSGDITVRQYLSTTSAQVTTENDADRLTSEAGVRFGKGTASFTLGYAGEYGETTDSHAFFGMLRVEF